MGATAATTIVRSVSQSVHVVRSNVKEVVEKESTLLTCCAMLCHAYQVPVALER